MRFRFIREHADTFSIGRMCQVLSVSRSGYYAWLRRSECRRSQRNRRLLIDIKAVYRIIYRSGLRLAEALRRAEHAHPSPETQHIVRFIQASKRGVISYA